MKSLLGRMLMIASLGLFSDLPSKRAGVPPPIHSNPDINYKVKKAKRRQFKYARIHNRANSKH